MPRPESLSFGKYRYVVDLGSGGMGDVFLAVAQGPQGFNKLQVIKRLRPELAEDPEFLAMFLNEARIAARLNHPNVVQTNEVSQDGEEYFIAMEYLEGQSLYMVTRRALAGQKAGAPGAGERGMPLAMHLHVLAEACEGLHYAHELADFDGTPLELVHRDCSPQNIFVTYEGEVKVLDFGIAKAADSATVTRTGVLKGKVPYMAPEQLDGARVDRRSDVFAIGAMLWEAASGSRLWKGLNDLQIAHRLHANEIPHPKEFNPVVDPKLAAIVMKALALRPEARFQSAAELQAAIEGYVARLGGVRRRDLGKYVSGLFLDTRKQLRQKVEDELRDVVPSWKLLLSTHTGEVRAASMSGEHATATGDFDYPTHDRRAADRPLSLPAPRRTPHDSHPTKSNQILLPPEEASHGPSSMESVPRGVLAAPPLPPELLTQRSTTMSVIPDTRTRGNRGRALALGLVALAVAGGLAAIVVVGRRPLDDATQTVSSALARASSSNEEKMVVPALPLVTIDVAPKEARIFINGHPVETPYRKEHAPGTRLELRIEAPGHVTKSSTIVVQHGPNPFAYALERASGPAGNTGGWAGAPKSQPHPVEKAAPTASAPPASTGGPKPNLDKEDPWK